MNVLEYEDAAQDPISSQVGVMGYEDSQNLNLDLEYVLDPRLFEDQPQSFNKDSYADLTPQYEAQHHSLHSPGIRPITGPTLGSLHTPEVGYNSLAPITEYSDRPPNVMPKYQDTAQELGPNHASQSHHLISNDEAYQQAVDPLLAGTSGYAYDLGWS